MDVMLMWQAVQPRFSCLVSSWRKVAESRRIHFSTTFWSVTPIAAAVFTSGSRWSRGTKTPDCPAGNSLWQPAQSVERGFSPPSCQWQLKQEAWLVGVVLNVPLRSHEGGTSPSGGLTTNLSADAPCGW